jgi:hypothetical protein
LDSGEVRNTHIFSATPVNQATGLQARQGDAVLEREKESSELLFKQSHFCEIHHFAHRDIGNSEMVLPCVSAGDVFCTL